MTNPTIDLLLKRKSIRVYDDRIISGAEKEVIIQAAMRAPTAGNMMLYTIIEIEDQALKDQLAVTCDNQPFIARAPYVLLFAADYQRWYDYYFCSGAIQVADEAQILHRRPEEGDLLLACCDTLIAAETAVIAAEALGIGSCYIGDILEHYETHRDLFALPQYVLPVTLICFGYPTPEQAERKQPSRFAREYIVHKNSYRRLSPEELEEMMRPNNARFASHGPRADGIANTGQLNFFKKFNADFSIEMSRSVRAMLADWLKAND
jgi:FMN reductase (NADPH)/FMN reductase [NAD(P)H]